MARRRLLLIGIVCVAAGCGGWLWFRLANDPVRWLAQARQAVRRQKHAEALELARRVLGREPNSVAALLIAAQSSRKLSDPDGALAYYERIHDSYTSVAAVARLEAGDVLLFDKKRTSLAEEQFRRLLAVETNSIVGHERLSYTLGLQSRYWDQIPHRLFELQALEPSRMLLYSVSLAENSLENPELVLEYWRASPDDLGNQLAAARVYQETKDYGRAEKLARSVLKQRPDWPDAHARLGRILVDSGTSSENLEAWLAKLPVDCWQHPALWFARGLACARCGYHVAAARCQWDAVRLDPAHQRAAYQLGLELVALDRKDEGQKFLQHAGRLEAYVRSCELAYNLRSPEEVVRAATQAEQLGLLREAWGWSRLAPQSSVMNTLRERVEPHLATIAGVRMDPRRNPTTEIDYSKLNLSSAKPAVLAVGQTGAIESTLDVTFQDDAAEAQLTFQYDNAGRPQQGLIHMYEVVGGGVCVVDFDGDGWPDLHFAQGAPWPLQPDQRKRLDRLFRNRGDGRFVDVTDSARFLENGFSQGGNVGDFNEDGFPDLYVVNIGGNRLFRNNGDGTFEDVTAQAGIAGDSYSTSGLVVDFNGDGLADIYEVNYLAGDDLFTRVCSDNTGKQGSCLPHLFSAAPDRCYLNQGDGRFKDITQESGIGALAGKGLGIVALRLGDAAQLSLFIANDVGVNFLLVNEASPGAPPRFVDHGLAAGVAYNRIGKYEASMGVAAGDSDGDGLIDLFVTNFDDETNTLYRQKPGGLFEDDTIGSRFSDKRQPYVGWGTQFIDGDLDGWSDLILTNGHVNDLRDKQKPYQMPAQYFRNLGGGRFAEVSGQHLGPYFQRNLLGRGLARLDWNRDGREDVVISHLDSPPALLTNTTRAAGQALRLRLRATRSSRDAIAAIVEVHRGDRVLTGQLTAGDGNQSANERQLFFGMGANRQAEKVTVRWPSGVVQEFGKLLTEEVWMLIEGHDGAVGLP